MECVKYFDFTAILGKKHLKQPYFTTIYRLNLHSNDANIINLL